jgi:hypothetical protein
MKKLLLMVLISVTISCSTLKQSFSPIKEDELLITRKYIGIYMDYRQTDPEDYTGPNLFWIKTSLENTYGKISVYGKKCEFTVGDRLYIRKIYYNPGIVSGYWVYNVENDSAIYYRATEFQHDHGVFVETWFQ